MTRAYELLNELMMGIFNEVLSLEEKALKYYKVKDLSVTEMHVVEVVGPEGSRTMSEVATGLGITIGTLSTTVNRLVTKGYLKRHRPDDDRRIVKIQLTRKGRIVYRLHAKFHIKVIDQMMKGLSLDEEKVMVKVLENVNGFFKKMSKKYKDTAQ